MYILGNKLSCLPSDFFMSSHLTLTSSCVLYFYTPTALKCRISSARISITFCLFNSHL